MILTGPEIILAHFAGEISLRPFAQRHVNPNSYNYHLGQSLVCLAPAPSGAIKKTKISIPQSGYMLQPGNLYLGATFEEIGSRKYAITLLGCSSVGRLGVFLNATSDFGHVGSNSNWTLEISVVQPVRLFPFMRIGQVAFWCTEGPVGMYAGRYLHDALPELSKDEGLRLNLVENCHDFVG